MYWFQCGYMAISTHTLCGERDRSATIATVSFKISTHTLCGERDNNQEINAEIDEYFNSHALWGA